MFSRFGFDRIDFGPLQAVLAHDAHDLLDDVREFSGVFS
jgi:hypothetical protein